MKLGREASLIPFILGGQAIHESIDQLLIILDLSQKFKIILSVI
ncbi:hypothetical protein QY96_02067 [Bacillus thermotolerans]|nr:hypothetical protein QY96_02067 [Bacillus thermotolerans]